MNEVWQHSVAIVVVVAAVTATIRFLPFILFPERKEVPQIMTYLSKVLPAAIIGMLVVYCFRGVALTSWPFGIPEGIAAAVVVLLYLWKRNILLPIATGTVLYMILVQLVFVS